MDSTSLPHPPYPRDPHEDAFLRLLQWPPQRNRTKTTCPRRTFYSFQSAGVSISKCWAYTDNGRAREGFGREYTTCPTARGSCDRTDVPYGQRYIPQEPYMEQLHRLCILPNPLLRTRIPPNKRHSLDRARLQSPRSIWRNLPPHHNFRRVHPPRHD